MKQIRKKVFETNSSSTHSLCISKNHFKAPEDVSFYIGEYGWEVDTVEPEDYFYTAICSFGEEKYNQYMEQLRSIFEKHGIECKFVETPEWNYYGENNEHSYLTSGYIDHSFELLPFINDLFNDEDKLLRFLFSSGSFVNTGNDNGDTNYPIETDDCEYFYKSN